MSLKTTSEDLKRRRRYDMLWQTVPNARCSNWARLITNGGLTSSTDDQWWWRCWAESALGLRISWTTEFISEVWRRSPVNTFIHENSEFEVDPLFCLQPVKLTKKRSDVVKPRRRVDQTSGCIHHRLESPKEMLRDTGQCCIVHNGHSLQST